MTADDAGEVRVVAVATDGSGTATRAVTWAANMAAKQDARLHVMQVLPESASTTERERCAAQLTESARRITPGATASVVVGDAIAELIVAAAEEAGADVLVVGNNGMRGRKEFLLGNVANRVTHLARCTVTFVNTCAPDEQPETDDVDSLVVAAPRTVLKKRLTLAATVLAALAALYLAFRVLWRR